MYGAAAWLVWVLAQEAGPTGVVIVLAALHRARPGAVAVGCDARHATRPHHRRCCRRCSSLLAGLYGVSQLRQATGAPAAQATKLGEPYTAAKLASLRATNRPVFVDATAAWCITCLVNEDAVLSRDSVKGAFASRNVAYLVADWTNQNPEITALLKENGRSGVPLYLYYAPGAATPRCCRRS